MEPVYAYCADPCGCAEKFEVYGSGAILASRESGWSGEDGWHYCPAHRNCHGAAGATESEAE